METAQKPKVKTIREAVEDGTLVDVTATAKLFGMQCRTFLAPSAWENLLERSEKKLHRRLRLLANFFGYLWGYERFGTYNIKPFTYIMEPTDEFGLVLVITEFERDGELNLRRTSDDDIRYLV